MVGAAELGSSVARVELLDAARAPLLARAFFAGGDPGVIARAMAQVPELMGPALGFFGAVLGPTSLPVRTKEMAVLRTSAVLACRYCVEAHTVVALDAGLSPAEVRALREAGSWGPAFPAPADQAVLAFIDALARGSGAVPDPVAAAASAVLPEHHVVELTLVVGTTMLLNRFCTALELPSSPETLSRLREAGLDGWAA